MISQADALRILDLPRDTPIDTARQRGVEQLRSFQEALALAADEAEAERIRRGITLTEAALARLRGRNERRLSGASTGPIFSFRHQIAVLTIGILMIVVGVWPEEEGDEPGEAEALELPALESSSDEDAEAPRPADAFAAPGEDLAVTPATPRSVDPVEPDRPDPVLASGFGVDAPEIPVETLRSRLDPVRALLVSSWQRQDDRLVLPPETVLAGLPVPDAPQGWRWIGQRDGIYAMFRDNDERWVVAAPIIRDGGLAWACLTPLSEIPGCLHLQGSRPLTNAVRSGSLDAFGTASAIEALRADERDAPGFDPEAWYRHAVNLGDPRAARRLSERMLGAAELTETDRREAYALLEFAHARYDETGDVETAAEVASAFAYHLAMYDQGTRERAAGWLVRCRDLLEPRGQAAAVCALPADFAYALEVRALDAERIGGDSAALWAASRWWYEQAVAEQSARGAEGLARLLALGRTDAIERNKALALLQDAAGRWPTFDQSRAATSAAELARNWESGWGIEIDDEQASWWHAQAARMGHVGSALQLASSFILGAGMPRDADRARQIVDMFTEYSPLFEIAFYRTVGERLEHGQGVAEDADAARAWYRRAFELCRTLAEDDDPAARLELAGMYFSGHGVDADPARAAELYTDLTEHDPVRAGNMLAWIRATAPDAALRDGGAAVALASDVVARQRSAEHLDTLAAALAEEGDYIEAVRTQRAALELLAANGDPLAGGADIAGRREEYESRLARYEGGRPWRDTSSGPGTG